MNRILLTKLLIVVSALTISTEVFALNISGIPPANNFVVGESFQIEVFANDALMSGFETVSFGFDVAISDSNVVQLNSYTVGPYFIDDLGFNLFADVSGTAFPGISENMILLAILDFSSIGVGSASIGIISDTVSDSISDWEGLFYANINDPFDRISFPIASQPSEISVSAAPVPEPATLILIASGLIGIGGFSRKRFNTKKIN